MRPQAPAQHAPERRFAHPAGACSQAPPIAPTSFSSVSARSWRAPGDQPRQHRRAAAAEQPEPPAVVRHDARRLVDQRHRRDALRAVRMQVLHQRQRAHGMPDQHRALQPEVVEHLGQVGRQPRQRDAAAHRPATAMAARVPGEHAMAPRQPPRHRHPVAMRAPDPMHQHQRRALAEHVHGNDLAIAGGEAVVVAGSGRAEAHQPEIAQRVPGAAQARQAWRRVEAVQAEPCRAWRAILRWRAAGPKSARTLLGTSCCKSFEPFPKRPQPMEREGRQIGKPHHKP